MKRTKKNLAGQRDIKVANDSNREQEVVYLSSHGDQGPGHRTSNGSQGRAPQDLSVFALGKSE